MVGVTEQSSPFLCVHRGPYEMCFGNRVWIDLDASLSGAAPLVLTC